MLDTIKSQLPTYAKDLKLNLSSLMREETLSVERRYGALFAAALASGNETLIKAFADEAGQHLSAEEIENAKAANAIMGMTNIYYRFLHMAKDGEYQRMAANLRMQIIGKPPADKVNFELFSLVVSAVNGCEFCVAAHDAELKKAGLSREEIQASIRIAATVHAVAGVLTGEETLAA
ncbi:carboxymuconolactone decarboxylase family protein [Kordiimonas laminariae]|uniref:carboxymuconolactone decarboxylase family protein n=1 Tax=Kordiimonas laminariae TaxID=2917717 RepID=UPI001FF45033|nr:carboxymuconolactone decarboxylase family protein [Kordiimonas laminariae]MCK0068204.1 carboxymuconolactone decarboxylase family protein [Kordiimonas laminariae]